MQGGAASMVPQSVMSLKLQYVVWFFLTPRKRAISDRQSQQEQSNPRKSQMCQHTDFQPNAQSLEHEKTARPTFTVLFDFYI